MDCLFRRAEKIITNKDSLGIEKSNLQRVLTGNGYPKVLVRNSLDRMSTPRTERPPEEEPLATAVLPYYQGISEAIRRILSHYYIRTAFRSSLSLSRLLTKVKDPVPKEERSGVIYKINCVCSDCYIGETGRPMATRMKEHKADCRYARFERSAVAEHAWMDGHEMDWENIEVLDVEGSNKERLVKEAFYIRATESKRRLNRDEGKDISQIWLQLKSKFQPRPPSRCRHNREDVSTSGNHTHHDVAT